MKLPIRLTVFLFLATLCTYAQQKSHVSIEDDSDWWSFTKDDTLGMHLRPQEKLLSDADLTIAGIRLGKDSDDAPNKFGKATEIERGDAAVGRTQICYRSLNGGTFLIFEWGEVDSAAYLFAGGKSWSGRDKCSASGLVNRQTSTARGLKLGSSIEDVTRILGTPTGRKPDTLIYFFQKDKKNSPEEIAKFLREYKEANGREGDPKDYEHYTVTSYIEAHFMQSRLTYLGMSTSETF